MINVLSYITLPYLRGGQVFTPAQRLRRISSAQCTSPESYSNRSKVKP